MRVAVIVFLFAAITALTAQSVRHAYLLWLQPRHSVLEKYDPPAHDKIKNATSLEALEKEYAAIRPEFELADAEFKAKNVKAIVSRMNLLRQNVN